MAKYAYHRIDLVQRPIVEYLESQGCVYQHLGSPIDGIVCVPVMETVWEHGPVIVNGIGSATQHLQIGRFVNVLVEFKTHRSSKLRKSQETFIAKWKGPMYVIRTQVEAAAMLAEVRR